MYYIFNTLLPEILKMILSRLLNENVLIINYSNLQFFTAGQTKSFR